MGQKQSEICPIYMKSFQVSQEIERRFIVSPHPLYTNREELRLLHEKLTNKKFMLRIFTADESQKKAIQARILKRVAFKNSSLTKLQHYIFEKMQSYCAKQFKIYILFELDPSTTLREEILQQGKGQPFFTEEQIIAGFQNLINGLLWIRYIKERHGNINTHHIYCSNHKMVLSDPLLCPQSHQYPQKYPSPEKLKEMNNRIDQYNHYQSDIFSIAMCMLEIIPTVKLDAIYKRNYTINEKNLREEINKCFQYPKLKTIFESLLLDPNNLENRRRYLELYSNKCTYLFKSMTQSSVSQKTVKIHTLGKPKFLQSKSKLTTFQQNKRNKHMPFNRIVNVQTQINSRDQPEIDTRMLSENQSRKTLIYQPALQERQDILHPNTSMFSSELKTDNFRAHNLAKKIVFNYNHQNQYFPITSFNELKTVSSRNLFPSEHPSNFQVPHHLYQFSTSSYNQRPKIDVPLTNPTISRSNSDYSVKSQLVVYEPNKVSFNVADLISPRRQIGEINTKQSEHTYLLNEINQSKSYIYQQKTPAHRQNMNTNLYGFDQENNLNALNSINKFCEPATSFGFLENEKLVGNQADSHNFQMQAKNIQQSLLVTSSFQNNTKANEAQISNMESLPLKLSILVKKNVTQQTPRDKQRQNDLQAKRQEQRQISVLKTPERLYYPPAELNNRTIPEEQHEQQQSFEGVQKMNRGSYKIEQYENGGRYEGFFLNNMRNGYGTFYYAEGGYYQGQWKNNLMNGHGKLYYDHERIAYDGQWYDDEFHGKGKVYNDYWEDLQGGIDYSSFENNELYWIEYDGELSHDVKQGLGKWKFSNGQYYEGEFKNDLPDGKGIFHSRKEAIKGFWNKGKLLMKM